MVIEGAPGCAPAQEQGQHVQQQLAALVAKYSSDDRQRQALHATLLADVSSADAWARVLQHEELCLKHVSRPDDGSDLLQLLELAAKTIPQQLNAGNHTYMQILSKYCRRLGRKDPAAARGYFYMLKQQGVGARSALLQHQWAKLEADCGNHEKAASILNKALRAGAEPPEVLQSLLQELEAHAVRATPCLPAAARPTPGSQVRPAAKALFGTPATAQRPAGVAPTPATLFASRPFCPTPSGMPLARGLESAMTAHGLSRYSKQPLAGGHTGGLTSDSLQLTRGQPVLLLDDRTTMSAGSGGTHSTNASSIDFGVSITRIMATPAAVANTMHSSSSRESGSTCEAETVELSRHSAAAVTQAYKPVEDTGNAAASQAAKRSTGARPAKAPVFRRLGSRLGPAARLSGGQDPPESMGPALRGAADGSASPEDSAVFTHSAAGGGAAASVEAGAPPAELLQLAAAATSCAALVSNQSAEAQASAAAASTPSHGIGSASGQAASHAQPPPRTALSPVGEDDEEETAPISAGPLARRVLAGRQSLAPSRQQATLRPVSQLSGGLQLSDVPPASEQQEANEPTVPLSNPLPRGVGAGHREVVIQSALASQPPAAVEAQITAEPDANETRPLSQHPLRRPESGRPPQQIQIDRSGNARLSAGRSPQSRISIQAPPPPPPHFARTTSLPSPSADGHMSAAGAGAFGAMSAEQRQEERPPAQHQQPAAAAAEQRQHQQQAAQHAQAQQVPHQQQRQQQQQQQQQPARPRQPSRTLPNGSIEDDRVIIVKNIVYQKLEVIGRGGSSKVWKVVSPLRKVFALKRIRLNGLDGDTAQGFADEIQLLRRLQGKENIIQLIDAELVSSQSVIYVILEYGEIDLARLLAKQEAKRREGPGALLRENFIRLYWQQMLEAVSTIHEARIVHSDLKPANFLVVGGELKLIDFGIAKAIKADTTSIARENQVGTLNYMSPEAILGGSNNIRGGPPMKVGRASDIWSLGCILYQMVYGRTPFFTLPFIQKMHAITNPDHHIDFPPLANRDLLHTIQRCLDRNPKTRATMQELLDHSFLWGPTAAPAVPSSGRVGLSTEEVRQLLQLAQKTGQDMEQLLEAACRQLEVDGQLDLDALAASSTAAAPPLQDPVLQKPALPAASAAAAAAHSGDTTVVSSGAMGARPAVLQTVTNLPQEAHAAAAGKAVLAAAAVAASETAR